MLNNDPSYDRGLVQIFHADIWGWVCDDFWDTSDASVVCRSIGFRYGTAVTGGVFTGSPGQIWLDNVICDGDEESLTECASRNYGDHDCSIAENAGVVCFNSGKY